MRWWGGSSTSRSRKSLAREVNLVLCVSQSFSLPLWKAEAKPAEVCSCMYSMNVLALAGEVPSGRT